MTPEERKAAIVKYCEWDELHGHVGHHYFHPWPSLDAMHAAERIAYSKQPRFHKEYADQLCRVMDPEKGYRRQGAEDIIFAEHGDREIAFLKTLNLWKP